MTMGGPPLPFGFCGSCGFACWVIDHATAGTENKNIKTKINNITLNMDSNAGPSQAPPLAALAKAPSQPWEATEAAASLRAHAGVQSLRRSQFFIKEAGQPIPSLKRPHSYSQYE